MQAQQLRVYSALRTGRASAWTTTAAKPIQRVAIGVWVKPSTQMTLIPRSFRHTTHCSQMLDSDSLRLARTHCPKLFLLTLQVSCYSTARLCTWWPQLWDLDLCHSATRFSYLMHRSLRTYWWYARLSTFTECNMISNKKKSFTISWLTSCAHLKW